MFTWHGIDVPSAPSHPKEEFFLNGIQNSFCRKGITPTAVSFEMQETFGWIPTSILVHLARNKYTRYSRYLVGLHSRQRLTLTSGILSLPSSSLESLDPWPPHMLEVKTTVPTY